MVMIPVMPLWMISKIKRNTEGQGNTLRAANFSEVFSGNIFRPASGPAEFSWHNVWNRGCPCSFLPRSSFVLPQRFSALRSPPFVFASGESGYTWLPRTRAPVQGRHINCSAGFVHFSTRLSQLFFLLKP